MRKRVAWLALVVASVAPAWSAAQDIVIGSKRFTESYILAEIMARALEDGGYTVRRQFGFGGTLICFEALATGEIDLYPEYTGTLTQTVFKLGPSATRSDLDGALAQRGLVALAPFGFDNTYAIAVSGDLARDRGLFRISDLRGQTGLRFGFSHEFLNRQDGWPGLAAAYGLQAATTGIDHALAYQAIGAGRIDVTDAYATDGDIERYGLAILTDDRDFFPDYLAVALAADSLPAGARAILGRLAGRIDDTTMRRLNARVVVDGMDYETVAARFLQPTAAAVAPGELTARLWRNTLRHLKLTGIALALATLVGVGGGLLVYRSSRGSRLVLYVTGLLQTIPSIALLALMIPLFGVGQLPAVVALFLYSLLPVVRSTITAMQTIAPLHREVARAIGLTARQQMRYVYLPLASPNLLTGIKTAAIISIGTATLAAFIGAGGLGEPIVTGLALNDVPLILQGAIPAALLAILTELVFEGVERLVVPKHLSGNRP